MTSEVVAMNRMGIALAADSAASITTKESDGIHKIYNSASKLFMLSRRYPVGIMIYNNASLLGIPWETIIKLFRQELGDTKYNTLEEYVDRFISYLENNQNLFPTKLQKRYYLQTLEAEYLSINNNIKKAVIEGMLFNMQNPEYVENAYTKQKEYIEEAIQQRVCFWKEKEDANYFNEIVGDEKNSGKKYISKEFVINFSGEINELINDIFGEWAIGDEYTTSLNELSELLISKEYFNPDWFSGVVIAGFGEKEHFPSMQDFKIGGIYENKLKYQRGDPEKITEDNPSIVKAFAYKKMFDNFLYGITLEIFSWLKEAAKLIRTMPVYAIDAIYDILPEQERERWKQFITDESEGIAQQFYTQALLECNSRKDKIIQEIEILPLDELAQVASTLVSLNSFQQRLSPGRETVGGPIDVAVISKGDGFIWIERKHYFQKELNYHFFQNHYHTSSSEEIKIEGKPDKQTPNTDSGND